MLAHCVRATAAKRPGDVWVALDLSNAFGRLKRQATLDAVDVQVPALSAHARLFLQRRSRYRFTHADGEAEWLYADEGAEQGDPLGPVYLSLALAPCVAALRETLTARL